YRCVSSRTISNCSAAANFASGSPNRWVNTALPNRVVAVISAPLPVAADRSETHFGMFTYPQAGHLRSFTDHSIPSCGHFHVVVADLGAPLSANLHVQLGSLRHRVAHADHVPDRELRPLGQDVAVEKRGVGRPHDRLHEPPVLALVEDKLLIRGELSPVAEARDEHRS